MKKLVKTKINGFEIYYRADDIFVGQNVARGNYEEYFTRLLSRNIKKGDTVMDIGANIGYDTLIMASRTGEKGRVLAFEPDPVNFEILRKNVSVNGFKNVLLINAGLGDKNKESDLYISKSNYGDHQLYDSGDDRERVRVEVRTLDDVIKEQRIKRVDLIKADTQGYEPAVFGGGKKTLRRDRPTLFFEYWPKAYETAGFDKRKMMKLLEDIYGGQIFFIDEYIQIYYRRKQKTIDEAVGDSSQCNLMAINNLSLGDKIGQFKDFQVKKFAKRGLGVFPLT
ncbi:MAG: FkbM family methyltransferase [Patescibacteria group bacterium]|jgi:FkbM family methyltransferase